VTSERPLGRTSWVRDGSDPMAICGGWVGGGGRGGEDQLLAE